MKKGAGSISSLWVIDFFSSNLPQALNEFAVYPFLLLILGLLMAGVVWFLFRYYDRGKKLRNLQKKFDETSWEIINQRQENQKLRAIEQTHQALEENYAQLLKEAEILQETLDILPLPIWRRNTEDGLLYCNKAYASYLSNTPEDTLKQNEKLWETPPGFSDYNLLPHAFNQHVIHNGDRHLLEFHERTNPKFNSIVGYAQDRTETEKIKREFDHHVSAYREVLKTLSAGVLVIGPDTRVKSFNHAYTRIFKLDPHWLHTEPTLGEVLDNLRERGLLMERPDYHLFKRHTLDLINTILTTSQELLHRPDGRTIRKIMSPHPMGGSFYIFEDITDAMTLEREHNTQLAVHKASLDNLYEGVAVFGCDNRLRLCNPAFRKMWHLNTESVKEGDHVSELAEKIRDFFPKTQWAQFKSKLIERITDRVPKKRKIHLLDGSILEINYVPLPDGSNLTSFIDMTEQSKQKNILKAIEGKKEKQSA